MGISKNFQQNQDRSVLCQNLFICFDAMKEEPTKWGWLGNSRESHGDADKMNLSTHFLGPRLEGWWYATLCVDTQTFWILSSM